MAGQPTRGERELSVSPSLGGLGPSCSSEAPPPGSFPTPSSSPTRLLELKLRTETGQRQEVAWESLGTSLPGHQLSPATPQINYNRSKTRMLARNLHVQGKAPPPVLPAVAAPGTFWLTEQRLLTRGAGAAGITLTWELVRPHSRPRADLPGDSAFPSA